MSPDAIQSAPAAQHPQTGPRTHEGKAACAQNAPRLKQETPPYPIESAVAHEAGGQDGIFAAFDFIRPGEQEEYDEMSDEIYEFLAPSGPIEDAFADEIVTAKWRLRRCGLIESHLALRADAECSLSEDDEKRQRSVDRARAQYNNLLRRAIADLRKVQTERVIRKEIGTVGNFGIADFSAMFRGVKLAGTVSRMEQRDNQAAQEAALQQAIQGIESAAAGFDFSKLAQPQPAPQPASSFCKTPADTVPNPPTPPPAKEKSDISFCKTPEASRNSPRIAPHKPGRNEPCPCKSGLKYKRCCLNKAA